MQLKPVLGPVQLVFYSVGVIVGAGVYSVIGAAAGLAQQSLWLSFLVGAGVALLTAVSYAEVATAFPAAGAEYVYVRRAWPKADWLAFGIGAVILIGGAASAATVAIAFGGYLRAFLDVPVVLSAFLLLIACTLLNMWGLRESSYANMVFTSIEVAGLVIVIAAAWIAEPRASAEPMHMPPDVMAAAALLFFVYLGFEEIANLAEEVRNPTRDIPLALFASMAITTVLYVATALAVVSIATPAELAGSEAPLTAAVNNVWPGGAKVLNAVALFATANTVLITIIATTRVAFSLGRDREIPALFGKLGSKRQTPWAAALLVLGMSAALVPIGNISILAEMASFAALAGFLSVNLVLIVLRYRLPRQKRPFRVPLTIGRMPVLPLVAIAAILVLLVHFDPIIYAAGAIAVVLSAAAYVLTRR